MQTIENIQVTHSYSDAYNDTHYSLGELKKCLEHRVSKVYHLRAQIEDIEVQNNRIMRHDEHKRALVQKGSEWLKFYQLTEEQENLLRDFSSYQASDVETHK